MNSNKRRIIPVGLLLALFLWSSPVAAFVKPGFYNIGPTQASELIELNENNPNFVVLDVRTNEEFRQGHIENAQLIDYYSQDFAERLDALDKTQTYLIYCRSGNRSGNTLTLMRELGFKEVYNISGGIRAWISAGLNLAF